MFFCYFKKVSSRVWSAWKWGCATRPSITWPHSRSHLTSPQHTRSLVWKGIKSGDLLSIMTLYPLLIEAKTVSTQGKAQPRSIRAANHQSLMSSLDLSTFPGVFCVWQLKMTNVSRSPTPVFTHPQSPFLHTCEWQNHAAVLPNSCRRRWLRHSGSLVLLQGRSRPSSSLEPHARGFHPWSKFRGQNTQRGWKDFQQNVRA